MDQDFAKRRVRTPLAEPSPPPRTSGLALLLTGILTGVVIGLFIGLLAYMSGLLPPPPGQQLATETPRDSRFNDAAPAGDVLTEELEREASRLQLEFYRELPNYEVVVDVTPVNVPQPRVTQPPATESAINALTDNTSVATDAASPPDQTEVTAVIMAATTIPGTPGSSSPTNLSIEEQVIAELTGRAPAPDLPPTTSTPAASGAFLLQAGAFQQQQAANTQLNRLLNLGVSARIREESMPGRTLYLVQAGPYNSRDDMLAAERILRSNNIDSMRITLSQP